MDRRKQRLVMRPVMTVEYCNNGIACLLVVRSMRRFWLRFKCLKQKNRHRVIILNRMISFCKPVFSSRSIYFNAVFPADREKNFAPDNGSQNGAPAILCYFFAAAGNERRR